MEKFKGTPGPWEIMDDDGELKIVQSGSIEYGQGWKIYSDICSEVSGQYNANLIAAATELLEALQELISGYEDREHLGMFDMLVHGDLIQKANAAINKALGE